MTTSRFGKLLVWGVGLLLVVGLFFSSNIRGYYRFKEICEKEAGLKVFIPIERNVGWRIRGERMEDAGFPLLLNDVPFVRYRSVKDGNLYDVFRIPKVKVGDSGIAQKPADMSKAVAYEYDVRTVDLPNELRTGAQHFEVMDLRSDKLAVRYSRFSFGKFSPDAAILSAPSGESCPEDFAKTDATTGKPVPSNLLMTFASVFTN